MPVDFGADPKHDPDPGILTEFLPFQHCSATSKKFATSTALAEVALSECFCYKYIPYIQHSHSFSAPYSRTCHEHEKCLAYLECLAFSPTRIAIHTSPHPSLISCRIARTTPFGNYTVIQVLYCLVIICC